MTSRASSPATPCEGISIHKTISSLRANPAGGNRNEGESLYGKRKFGGNSGKHGDRNFGGDAL